LPRLKKKKRQGEEGHSEKSSRQEKKARPPEKPLERTIQESHGEEKTASVDASMIAVEKVAQATLPRPHKRARTPGSSSESQLDVDMSTVAVKDLPHKRKSSLRDWAKITATFF
jgi:hypothetical protein